MLKGQDYIYKCPSCGNLLKRGSIGSGNTFGAKVYSDGKMVAPMLKDFPELTKCQKCGNFLRISEAEEVGSYFGIDCSNDEWLNADMVEFLTIAEYVEALKHGMAEDIREEKFIRQEILWAFNDRIRDGKAKFETTEEEDIWNDNLDRLIVILDNDDPNEMVMMADIHRTKGDFTQCMSIISTLEEPQLQWLRAAFQRECGRQNQQVFQLQ